MLGDYHSLWIFCDILESPIFVCETLQTPLTHMRWHAAATAPNKNMQIPTSVVRHLVQADVTLTAFSHQSWSDTTCPQFYMLEPNWITKPLPLFIPWHRHGKRNKIDWTERRWNRKWNFGSVSYIIALLLLSLNVCWGQAARDMTCSRSLTRTHTQLSTQSYFVFSGSKTVTRQNETSRFPFSSPSPICAFVCRY